MSVYLLHFNSKVSGYFQHYIGYCNEHDNYTLIDRIERHVSGHGSKLTRLAKQQGIGFWVVRTWPGEDYTFERKLKDKKCAWKLCPICNPNWKNGG